MLIRSINIGRPKKESFPGGECVTGICKLPVKGPLRLSFEGFEGDGVQDVKHHGGVDKAVCVYSLDHYPYWERTLGIPMPPAAFGENFSVEGLSEEDVHIGDFYTAGTAVLQVSQPRQPCKTLSARHGRKDMVALVVASGRTGFYFRVIEEGMVRAGDELILKEADPLGVSVSYANRIYHHQRNDLSGIERVLAVPALSASWRKSFEELRQRST